MPTPPSQPLSSLGWDEFFENQYEGFLRGGGNPKATPARVVGEERGLFRLWLPGDLSYWGEISGKWFHGATSRRDLPATGDWVACEPRSSSDRATIHHLFQRKTCLIRKAAGETRDEQVLATNVDTVFILSSLNQDLNLRRLERYLALVWDSGAVPVILLTKADLKAETSEAMALVKGIAPGVNIHIVSSRGGQGLGDLTTYLQSGKTSVLLGSSGVGKSTLANRLLGRSLLKTQDIREHDDKGRHTTTTRFLVRLDSGALLIDTPGIRELQLLDHEEGVGTLFSEFEELSARCKFRDCKHGSEPGCAVKEAVTAGKITRSRLESYHKLIKELAFDGKRGDRHAASRDKAKAKSAQHALRTRLQKKKK